MHMVETMSAAGHWHYEINTGQIIWSEGMYRFFGLEPGTPPLSFEQFLEATVPEDRAAVREAVAKATSCGGEYRLRRRVRIKSGEIRIMQSHAICETAADGSVHTIFGVFNDITEIARAEEQARQNAFHLRHIIDAVNDHAIFMLDAGGNVASWNSGAERLKGYVAEEIMGRHFSCFYTTKQCRDGLPDRLLAAAAAKGSARDEDWRVRRDGSEFWASVSIHPMRGDDGKLLGFAKVTHDLTERKKYEDELKRARESALSRRRQSRTSCPI